MVEEWLKKNGRFINYRSLERTIMCPRGILQKFVKYGTRITDKWIKSLYKLIEEITVFTKLNIEELGLNKKRKMERIKVQ